MVNFLLLGQSKLVFSAHVEIRDFSAYRAGYMRKNPRFVPRPRRISYLGLEFNFDNENLKNLHANERAGHGKLLGKNGVGFRRTKLPKFAFEFLSSIW